jgi:amidase
MCVGNRIYMNASHAGGLLFVGDVHASQGDSELTGVANETAATVVASADVIKGRQVPGVMRIETPTALIQVDSARLSGNQDRALHNCFENMVNWLCEDFGVSRREAYLMMSVNSLVRVNVYQYVCGNFVCGVEFPKATLGL